MYMYLPPTYNVECELHQALKVLFEYKPLCHGIVGEIEGVEGYSIW